jgi:hypothetical protein
VGRFVSCTLPDGPLNVTGDTSKERTDVKFGDIEVRLKTSTALLDFAMVNFLCWLRSAVSCSRVVRHVVRHGYGVAVCKMAQASNNV